MIVEGARVAYVGHHRMLAVGDEGVALDVGTSGTHVRWTSGSRVGSIDLVRTADLVVAEQDEMVTKAAQARQDALSDGWGLAEVSDHSGIDDDELGWI